MSGYVTSTLSHQLGEILQYFQLSNKGKEQPTTDRSFPPFRVYNLTLDPRPARRQRTKIRTKMKTATTTKEE